MLHTPFPAESVTMWRRWMEAESAYGLRKFPLAVQYDYYQRVGVAGGDFSWKESALGYLKRGVIREYDNNRDLRQVQTIGKAALNVVNLALTAQCYHRQPRRAVAVDVKRILAPMLSSISKKFGENHVPLSIEGEKEFEAGLDALHSTYAAVMDGASEPGQLINEIVDFAAPINY